MIILTYFDFINYKYLEEWYRCVYSKYYLSIYSIHFESILHFLYPYPKKNEFISQYGIIYY